MMTTYLFFDLRIVDRSRSEDRVDILPAQVA
jgi:hypothetical protein